MWRVRSGASSGRTSAVTSPPPTPNAGAHLMVATSLTTVGDAMDIDPDGTEILTGSWRPENQLQVHTHNWHATFHRSTDFTARPRSGCPLTVTGLPAQTWDLGTGALIDTIAWPTGVISNEPSMVYAARYSPDGKYVAAGGSGANELRVFDRKSGESVSTTGHMAAGIYSLDWVSTADTNPSVALAAHCHSTAFPCTSTVGGRCLPEVGSIGLIVRPADLLAIRRLDLLLRQPLLSKAGSRCSPAQEHVAGIKSWCRGQRVCARCPRRDHAREAEPEEAGARE